VFRALELALHLSMSRLPAARRPFRPHGRAASAAPGRRKAMLMDLAEECDEIADKLLPVALLWGERALGYMGHARRGRFLLLVLLRACGGLAAALISHAEAGPGGGSGMRHRRDQDHVRV